MFSYQQANQNLPQIQGDTEVQISKFEADQKVVDPTEVEMLPAVDYNRAGPNTARKNSHYKAPHI